MSKKPSERPLCIDCRWHSRQMPGVGNPYTRDICLAEFSLVDGETKYYTVDCEQARNGAFPTCGKDGDNFEPKVADAKTIP